MTTDVPPRYGQKHKSAQKNISDAIEDDLAKVEPRRRGPAIAARLSGRAELFKERLDRDSLKDPETGVEYDLATMRPFFVKDNQAVFLYSFFQMLRCTRGQMDYQRWLIKYEIVRRKAIEAWLGITTLRPAADHVDVVAEVGRLRQAEQDRLRAAVRQNFAGPKQICSQRSTLSLCQLVPTLCVKQLERHLEATSASYSGSIPDHRYHR